MGRVELKTLVLQSITVNGILEQIVMFWNLIKAPFIVPTLQVMVNICLVMSVMLFLERVCMGIVKLFIKLLGRKPEKNYKWEAMQEDVEYGTSNYPMVLVQIPMYNEKEVYQLSIGAACGLSWPSDRIIVQVLDDSTDLAIKELVEVECIKWASKGINIKYEIRHNRNGYKAGALKEGLKHSYVSQCDFVAIFDADFQPEPDFLCRTIPFFVHNPDIGLVQARWKFANADECLMTRMQEMSLNYHFSVEQEVGSQTCAFFGFNGTAGVWRFKALNEAGGWKDRTTVEDMDLAVRASLQGWKFVFVGDIKVISELPSTFKAFRYQQHRWSCGPSNLFKKMAIEIAMNKVHFVFVVIYSFSRSHIIKIKMCTQKRRLFFILYSRILHFVVCYRKYRFGRSYTCFIVSSWCERSLHLVVFWVVFENVMAMHRTKATIIGLLEIGNVNEWVVTEKLGDASKTKASSDVPVLCSAPVKKSGPTIWERVHGLEMVAGLFLLCCGCYDFVYGKNYFYIYIFLQSVAFFVVGFGYVGTFVPK
ncbi:glucomannan 4-beta-mannosyltransferase 9-like isoform X2 [Apium graveolens]|uniref:glucomannan 4-beta-mannosyltransferase 9-like isoform X2 n=1 Tax=Apium graveolens TaxID=4045 RepID=UPI003D7B7B34